jgi:hypothetical protein
MGKLLLVIGLVSFTVLVPFRYHAKESILSKAKYRGEFTSKIKAIILIIFSALATPAGLIIQIMQNDLIIACMATLYAINVVARWWPSDLSKRKSFINLASASIANFSILAFFFFAIHKSIIIMLIMVAQAITAASILLVALMIVLLHRRRGDHYVQGPEEALDLLTITLGYLTTPLIGGVVLFASL